ncbi:TIGR01244 family sulfur transferase [Nitrincola sp. MINF-07-Sa-05]|uniref:TIGR01244 family sulfur transferase n=1 Tax=Nitrincola salilacus TaxID=3400273 RepID=UPI0039185DAA
MEHTLPPMRQLTDSLRACGQLQADDIRALAKEGVRTLICNRPDQEEPNQPGSDELADLARQLGISWYYQPVITGQVTDEQGLEFGKILQQAEAPVVAFCRSGARCGTLWALSQKPERSGDELVAELKRAGYEMPDFFKRLTG